VTINDSYTTLPARFIKIIATVGSMQHSRNHSIGRKRSDPFILVSHLAPTGTEDGTLNALNRNIPVSVQHYMRDKGIMRFLADTSALLAATTLGATKQSILKKFLDTGERMTCFFLSMNIRICTSDNDSD
jgi:hypothetical protein